MKNQIEVEKYLIDKLLALVNETRLPGEKPEKRIYFTVYKYEKDILNYFYQLFEPKPICAYCGKPADAAMLVMGISMAHPACVIQKLNELLDSDYDGASNPDKIIGILPKPDESSADNRGG